MRAGSKEIEYKGWTGAGWKSVGNEGKAATNLPIM